MYLALIILPGYPEDDLTLRLTDPLNNFALKIFRMLDHNRSKGFKNLQHGLMELDFAWIALEYVVVDTFDLFIQLGHKCPLNMQNLGLWV
jgi:hypothetical protein